jgi:death-on-curing protein
MIESLQWLTLDQVLEINQGELELHRKEDGLRDKGLLLSALNRPYNMLNYGRYLDIPALSAVYATGIIQNHPFIDGNKRTGFLTSVTFLILNGFRFDATEKDAAEIFLKLANNEIDEEMLVNWFRVNSSEILSPET